MQIFCFGDSITWGGNDINGGWADRLKRAGHEYVESHPDEWLEVYNLGIPGDTTEGLLRRFSNESSERIENGIKPKFLFAFGANDAYFIDSKKTFRCSPESFEANYRKVITAAKQFSDDIFILTITPVDESRCIQGDKLRKNEFIDRYNAIIKQLANDEQINVIDVNQAYIEHGYADLFGNDGLHPNAKGHELIYSLVTQGRLISV